MRPIGWIAIVATVAAAGACTPTPPSPVPVSAPEDTSALAGEWAGEYESPAVGRAGSIVFHLDAGRDTAQGDVVMVPRGSQAALQRAPAEPGTLVRASTASSAPQVLTIRFVRVQGDRVTGVLDPYLDPDCGCRVFTAFEGTLAGDRLRGTFETRGSPAGPVTGTWSVERRARKPRVPREIHSRTDEEGGCHHVVCPDALRSPRSPGRARAPGHRRRGSAAGAGRRRSHDPGSEHDL